MTIGFRSLPSTALVALLLTATLRAEEPNVRLQLVADRGEPRLAAADGDEPLPTPIVPRFTEEDLVETLPPRTEMERELVAAPNPYETTLPEDAWDPATMGGAYVPHGHRMPHGPMHPRAHAMVEHWQMRPRQAPLEYESWLNRPVSFSLLFGGFFLDDPVGEWLDGDPGIMFGGRIGWDFEPKWGVEARLAGAYPGINEPNGTQEFPAAHVLLWDLNWHYYWTGNTRWRPYVTAGLGALDLRYESAFGNQHNTSLTVPFGIGLKYRHTSRMAMRIDLMDNFSFPTGIQGEMHNISLTMGFEARFGGGQRRNYWPWVPGRDWR